VEHTNFVPAEHFGGDHILYCGDYLESDHEYFHLSPEEIARRFLPRLGGSTRILTNRGCARPGCSLELRPAGAIAQPLAQHPGYPHPHPGLFFASMSQVYPWDRGTNYAVEIARGSGNDDAAA